MSEVLLIIYLAFFPKLLRIEVSWFHWGKLLLLSQKNSIKPFSATFFNYYLKLYRQSLEICMRFRFNEHSICMYYVCMYPIPSLMSGPIWMKLWMNIVIHKAILMCKRFFFKELLQILILWIFTLCFFHCPPANAMVVLA